MDIAGLAMNLSTVDTQAKVSVAMLDKTMELGETLGEGMVAMIDAAAMERSVRPEVGSNMDISI